MTAAPLPVTPLARTRLAGLALVALLGLAACASAPGPTGGDKTVEAWLTTGDRSKLLAREPALAFTDDAPLARHIEVDPSRRYQEMVGFGAAITDASAWLIQHRLTDAQRDALMRELFGGAPGLGLSFTRLTIGATDFSLSHYSFDDMPAGQDDPTLARFSIEPNRAEVLPTVKAALALNPALRVMASSWSAPGWMKTSDSLIKGRLKPEAYDAYAEYLLRYIEAYAAEGVPMYAITVQNEPHFEPPGYPGMRIDTADRARLIGFHIGPRLARSGLGTRLLDWDHNWDEPGSPLAVLDDANARRYIDGVAWHCYGGDVGAQATVHDAYPDKDVYFTECSNGEWAPLNSDGLTWLTRNLIVGAPRAWARGVLLWNLALDENHGPRLGGCPNCTGVVTIDSRTGAVTRNADYYALAHASRFVRPGARRIESTSLAGRLDTVAFENADDRSVVLIAVNSTAATEDFSVRSAGRTFRYSLPGKSVATFIWRP